MFPNNPPAEQTPDECDLLKTFDPRSKDSMRDLMPIGVTADHEGRRIPVGVPWGGTADPMLSLISGAPLSGKTLLAASQMLALCETGRGFLLLDAARTTASLVKEHLVSQHADRIVEVDLQGVNSRLETALPGWNPLDVTVVPSEQRRQHVDMLKEALPKVLLPYFFDASGGEPSRCAVLLSKSVGCLLELNLALPPELQTTLFCLKTLLTDSQWRHGAIETLPRNEQKWWSAGLSLKSGEPTPAVRQVVDAVSRWEMPGGHAMLGASVSTVRWREIIERNMVVLVVLNDGMSDLDTLIVRLALHEISTAARERPAANTENPHRYHLFLNNFDRYSSEVEQQVMGLALSDNTLGLETHLVGWDPDVLSFEAFQVITGKRTHVFAGRSKGADGSNPASMLGVELDRLELLPPGRFLCEVLVPNGERSALFETTIGSFEDTWGHLRVPVGLSKRIRVEKNSGWRPEWERQRHIESLPIRVGHWLETRQTLTIADASLLREQTRRVGVPEQSTPPTPEVRMEEQPWFETVRTASNQTRRWRSVGRALIGTPVRKRAAVSAGLFLLGFTAGLLTCRGNPQRVNN